MDKAPVLVPCIRCHHRVLLKTGKWLTKVSDLPEGTQAVNGGRNPHPGL